jgi:hypothetical protein
MTKEKDSNLGVVKLPKVRLSYPALFVPKPGLDNPDKKKYGASLIFPKSNKKLKEAIEAAYEEVCLSAFNNKVPAFKGNKYPIRDGDEPTDEGESKGEEYEGMFYLNAKNDKKPVLMDGRKNRIVEDDGTLYAGCYVNAIVRLYAVNNVEKNIKGVFVSLEGIMFAGHGEAFGAPQLSEEEFDDFEDAEDAEDDNEEF